MDPAASKTAAWVKCVSHMHRPATVTPITDPASSTSTAVVVGSRPRWM